MKRSIRLIVLMLILSLALTGCKKDDTEEEYKEVLQVSDIREEAERVYYKLDDDTNIYTSFDSIKYQDKELAEALNDNVIFDSIIKNMKLVTEANDGGSKYYQDGNVYVTICNSLEENGNNHNIYITKKLEEPLKVCSINIKKIEDCVKSALSSYLTTSKISTKNGKLTSITKNKNYESVTYKKSSKGEFILIKTEDASLIKDLKAYFKKKNKKYYYANFTIYTNELYHVLFYNNKNSNPEAKVTSCINNIYGEKA